jgi:negative modulator of initiation of replication
MRRVGLDDDVYQYLMANGLHVGESASSILRRVLNLPVPRPPRALTPEADHELSEALEDPKFTTLKTSVDRLLYILGVVYDQKRSRFGKVLSVRGRNRLYYAKTRQEIERSGNSTQPKRIPGSPYWVMTNSPTGQKKTMLSDTLTVLGYSHNAIVAASSRL